ncbi:MULTISPECIES: alpha/beta fold hydrolase [Methylocaldum]|uniref:alpha/beta fold hydrolase n=1 Tax=Methylocaldum sp. GT1TLB TaxID=3438965 RepID=UPI0012EC558C|nr:alpha/beta fold hydrolase [Methylocaldum sp. BRCS4]
MPRLQIRGAELHYESLGHGPSLLFIHGLGSSTRDWEAQLAYFSPRFHVVTFDLRGHGRSDKPPGPYSILGFAADTAELIRLLSLGPTHVVGLSMGGMIAFQLAISAPELVQSLVIVNSGPEFILRTLRARLQIVQRKLIVRLLGMRQMGKVLGKRLFPEPEQAELRQLFIDRWAENDPRAYLDALRALIGWTVADHLDAIHCPALVITSDQDYTPIAVKETYVARMPQAELAIIRDARHMLPLERPDAFNQVLMEFLLKHRPFLRNLPESREG